jgi:hypothetical protein
MPILKRKCTTDDQRFINRVNGIYTANRDDFSDMKLVSSIPIPNNVVLCNGCNTNLAEAEKPEDRWGWLIYLSVHDLRHDHPYDIYCDNCTKRMFPDAKSVMA